MVLNGETENQTIYCTW